MISLGHFVALSTVLFCIGLFGVLTQRNAIRFLISIELIPSVFKVRLNGSV